ncbi:CopD family protein [Mycolicibacterium frederiksbergense]|uniref:CopD family protein n=1 Tax=Mycolicibacterium frederiksbergense TaxID=117567 RepID=UPI0021F3C656|nr:CopD family protein [Mycolicibacterium frederiksbergense]
MEPTPHVTPTRRACLGALVVALSIALAWILSRPADALVATLTRLLADGAAVLVLGLAVVPWLDTARYRAELARRSTAVLAVAAWVWLAAELIRLVQTAADTAAITVRDLGVRTAFEFAVSTTAGRADLICVVAALVVVVLTIAVRNPGGSLVIAGVAALGTAARTLAGHLSESALGGLAVTLHALAAALWCGVLAAIVLVVDRRGQWARVLPRFSALSLWSVLVLLAGGVLSAAVVIGAPAELVGTGYGRLLVAKVVVTAVLMALAWQNRSRWLPSARGHRASAELSTRRAHTELALMAVALTLATALAVTG